MFRCSPAERVIHVASRTYLTEDGNDADDTAVRKISESRDMVDSRMFDYTPFFWTASEKDVIEIDECEIPKNILQLRCVDRFHQIKTGEGVPEG